jgi:hypothetical protein
MGSFVYITRICTYFAMSCLDNKNQDTSFHSDICGYPLLQRSLPAQRNLVAKCVMVA